MSHRFDIEVDIIKRMRQETRSQAEFIEKFFMAYAKEQNKEIWGDRTPRNITSIDFIQKHFPRAKFIHIIRDGSKYTVCSLRTHPKYVMINGRREKRNTCNPIDKCINRWVESVTSGLIWRGYPNYFEVKYETLVYDCERTLRDICKFLNIDFHLQMLEHNKDSRFSGDTSRLVHLQYHE